jgi:molybdenum cofactor cytidylyltransferase
MTSPSEAGVDGFIAAPDADLATRIDGILLAAGESRRMGYPKALLQIDGQTYLARLAAGMLTAVDRLLVVIGAHAARVRCAVPNDTRISIVENQNFARGQLSSLKAGIAALGPSSQAVVIHLVDHPMVQAATFRVIVGQAQNGRAPIVVARFNGRRGHPVLFDRGVFAELTNTPDDLGARAVVNADGARVSYCDVDDPGVVLDLDTPDELAAAGLPAPSNGSGE